MSALGRFELVEVRGEHGAAVLWLARDPELGRDVLLLVSTGPPREGLGAVARLAHPNVLTVHERGAAGDATYLAIEHVAGMTLDRWLAAAPRAAPAVCDVLAQIARGLAAIHAAGGAVGGFAATSVIVDRDGRARVVPSAEGSLDADADVSRFREIALASLETGARRRAVAAAGSLADVLAVLAAPVRPRRRWPRWIAIGGGVALAAGVAIAARAARGDRPGVVVRLHAPRVLADLGGCPGAPVFLDGHTVVFTHQRGEHDGVFAVDSAGGTAPRLIFDEPGAELATSAGDRPGTAIFLHQGLRRIDADGRVESIAQAFNFFVSPGVTAAAGDLIFVGGDGTSLRRMRGEREEVIATMPGGAMAFFVMVSPDDRWATLVSPDGLFLADLEEGNEPRRLSPAEPPYHRAPLTAGAALIYYPGDHGLHRLDPVSGRDELVVPTVGGIAGVDLSPDAATLVWSECIGYAAAVDITDPASPRELFRGQMASPAAMADGSFVYAAGTVIRRWPDGTDRRLSGDAEGFVVGLAPSADGREVAFVSVDPHAGVYVTDTEGVGPPRRIGDGESVGWLPDGRLAWDARDATGDVHVMAAPPGGGPPAPIHPAPRRLAASGHGVVLLTGADYTGLRIWDPATGVERAIELGPLAAETLRAVEIAPDGASALVVPGLRAAIWRVALDGATPPVRITGEATRTYGAAVITADGRTIAFETGSAGRLYAFDLDVTATPP